jgi:hypothetical protein
MAGCASFRMWPFDPESKFAPDFRTPYYVGIAERECRYIILDLCAIGNRLTRRIIALYGTRRIGINLAMIIPEDSPEPPDQVFMLATPAHMLTKLHWEIYSLRKSLSEKPEHIGHTHAPAYCAFNCAVTAWQLADWVWNACPADRRAELLALLGTAITGDDRKDFTNFQTAIRNKSRALHICRQLATGSKHMIVTKHRDPNVRAEMRWESEPARAGQMRAGDPLAVYHYRLVVSDKGIERAAIDVFTDAFKDWERFLGSWGFVEGRQFVSAQP